MNSSPKTQFLSEIAAGEVISQETLAYLSERLRRRVYSYVLRRFREKESAGELTRAELARRIQREPSQVTRLLGAPGNWTFDTTSALLAGICGEELEVNGTSLLNRPARNDTKPDWLIQKDSANIFERAQMASMGQQTGSQGRTHPGELPTFATILPQAVTITNNAHMAASNSLRAKS